MAQAGLMQSYADFTGSKCYIRYDDYFNKKKKKPITDYGLLK